MLKRMDRLTVKLTPYLMQKLIDMKAVFKVSYSVIVRTMMEAYFEEHDEVIEKLIDDFYEKNNPKEKKHIKWKTTTTTTKKK